MGGFWSGCVQTLRRWSLSSILILCCGLLTPPLSAWAADSFLDQTNYQDTAARLAVSETDSSASRTPAALSSDLKVSKTLAAGQKTLVYAGETITYTITLHAVGAEGFTELQLIEHPAGGTWSNPTGGLVLPDGASGSTLRIAALPAGATYTVDYSVVAPAGWVSSTVSVSAFGGRFIMITNAEIFAADSDAVLPDPPLVVGEPEVPTDPPSAPDPTAPEDPSEPTVPGNSSESTDPADSSMPQITVNTLPPLAPNTFVNVIEPAKAPALPRVATKVILLPQSEAAPQPSSTLGDAFAPLDDGDDPETGWSLVNLFAALGTLIAVFLHVLLAAVRGNAPPVVNRAAQGDPAQPQDDEDGERLLRVGVVLKLILSVLAMLSLTVFFLTGDPQAPMTLTNGMTGTMAVLLFSVIIIIIADIALSKIDEYEDEYIECDYGARAWLS
ncbi:MAG: hypothetical protein LBC23_04820 [Coriobacteriales bacterium]|jgi:hypothetical protein|nr:hypothetical protein [Coriobacteriales bacterium]